jgi:ADP-ribosyl-[dinitrogen reductase] hydrolase
MVKTSRTHPLVIHEVGTPGGGRVGMTLCPGKRQPYAVTGPWDRDLDIDMDVIKTSGAAMLITLMGPDELVSAAVPGARMKSAAEARGLTWLHLPIPDLAAPEVSFEDAWHISGPKVRAHLRNGGCVVVHCRGGRGRAGTIAARLLVELGVDPAAAIAQVRSANSYAMETAVQETHVRLCTAVSP